MEAFLHNDYVEVLDFPEEVASHYAKIRAELKVRGNAIGANAKWPRRSQGVLSASSSTCYFSLRHQQRNIVGLLAGSELLYGRND